VKPGSGPRHLAFRPDEKFAYAIDELTSTITAFKYNKLAERYPPCRRFHLARKFLR